MSTCNDILEGNSEFIFRRTTSNSASEHPPELTFNDLDTPIHYNSIGMKEPLIPIPVVSRDETFLSRAFFVSYPLSRPDVKAQVRYHVHDRWVLFSHVRLSFVAGLGHINTTLQYCDRIRQKDLEYHV